MDLIPKLGVAPSSSRQGGLFITRYTCVLRDENTNKPMFPFVAPAVSLETVNVLVQRMNVCPETFHICTYMYMLCVWII